MVYSFIDLDGFTMHVLLGILLCILVCWLVASLAPLCVDMVVI